MDGSDFARIPQLSVPDADLLVVFLSPEATVFLNKTEDPWYRATTPITSIGSQSPDRNLYASDEAASPMACLERFQYCNSSKECGSLASFKDALISALPLFHHNSSEFWGSEQLVHGTEPTSQRFDMFEIALTGSDRVSDLINTLGSSSLLSSQYFGQGFMGPIPDNQWQLDVSHWFAMHLASMQAAFVNIARGPTNEALLPYFIGPEDGPQQVMCNNMVSNTLFNLSSYQPGFCEDVTN